MIFRRQRFWMWIHSVQCSVVNFFSSVSSLAHSFCIQIFVKFFVFIIWQPPAVIAIFSLWMLFLGFLKIKKRRWTIFTEGKNQLKFILIKCLVLPEKWATSFGRLSRFIFAYSHICNATNEKNTTHFSTTKSKTHWTFTFIMQIIIFRTND